MVNADLSVYSSASLTHPGVTVANCSSCDPWRLSPRRHRVPIALTQTLGLSQSPPPAASCVDFWHLTGRPQSKHFWCHHHQPSHKEPAARCSTQFDHNNDECAGLSARISITTMNECRWPSRRPSAWAKPHLLECRVC